MWFGEEGKTQVLQIWGVAVDIEWQWVWPKPGWHDRQFLQGLCWRRNSSFPGSSLKQFLYVIFISLLHTIYIKSAISLKGRIGSKFGFTEKLKCNNASCPFMAFLHTVKGHQAGSTGRKWKLRIIWHFSSGIWFESWQTIFLYQLVGPESLEKIILWRASRFNVFSDFLMWKSVCGIILCVSRNECCKQTA